jgi:multisubunit Na+/H+ antiporter MnhB subunit
MALRKSLGWMAALLAFAWMAATSSSFAQNPDANGTGDTTVSLTFSPTVANDTYNPSAKVTFTCVVISNTGGATPTGSVTFTNATTGAQLTGSPVQLDGTGTSILAVTSGLEVGGNNVIASYSGDTSYAAKDSQQVVVTMEKSSTSLTVTPATTTPVGGASLAVSVPVTVGSPPIGEDNPTGAVTLNVDGKATGTAALATVGGVTAASFSITAPAAGSHALQAVYNGDDNYVSSTSPAVTITVSKFASTTTLSAAPTTLQVGIPVALTAVVNAASGVSTSIAPTGTVSFYDGATLLGTQQVSSYSATLSNIMLDTTKSHLVTAVYSGDTNYAGSTSNAVSLTAALLPDTVTLVAVPTAAGPGQAINFTATVTPVTAPPATYEQNPTGKVTFYNGTTLIGTGTLMIALGNSSTATFTIATLPAGQDTITAVYVGDSYFAPGTSNAVTVTVQDFTIAPVTPPTSLTIPKGDSGQASFIVAGLAGYTGQIQVTCNVLPQDDMTCTPTPVQVTPTGTVTFTVQTYKTGGPASNTSRRSNGPMWLRAGGGMALALVMVLAPVGRKARRLRRFGALILLLAGLCGAGVGCNSTNNGSNGAGTPLGTTTVTLTATSYIDNAVVSHSVYLTVNVIPPTD